jgi:hypothetical protein
MIAIKNSGGNNHVSIQEKIKQSCFILIKMKFAGNKKKSTPRNIGTQHI